MVVPQFSFNLAKLLSSSINNVSDFIKSATAGPDLIINTSGHRVLFRNY